MSCRKFHKNQLAKALSQLAREADGGGKESCGTSEKRRRRNLDVHGSFLALMLDAEHQTEVQRIWPRPGSRLRKTIGGCFIEEEILLRNVILVKRTANPLQAIQQRRQSLPNQRTYGQFLLFNARLAAD